MGEDEGKESPIFFYYYYYFPLVLTWYSYILLDVVTRLSISLSGRQVPALVILVYTHNSLVLFELICSELKKLDKQHKE